MDRKTLSPNRFQVSRLWRINNLYSGTIFQQTHLTPMQVVLLMRGICKGDEHFDPADPPRRRANKQRGHGTYENDRPPFVGTVGRESGQVRLRVVHHTDQKTLVKHGEHEWARDDDGEGMWTDVRTFLRAFKGVHKRFLSGYIAMAEFRRNLKRISPVFIASLVTLHTIHT